MVNTGQVVAQLMAYLRAYVGGQISLAELHGWITDQEATIVGEAAEWDDLTGAYWSLLAELQEGTRDEDSVRAELTKLIGYTQDNSGYFTVRLVHDWSLPTPGGPSIQREPANVSHGVPALRAVAGAVWWLEPCQHKDALL